MHAIRPAAEFDDAVSGLTDETAEIVSICEILEKLTPEIGAGRVESAEYYLRAQTNCIALVAGEVAELILHPGTPVLGAMHDHIEARSFARVACASTSAATALISYARAEAQGLLLANLGVLRALVDAIVARGTLLRDEIDEIIAATLAQESVAAEHEARRRWQGIIDSASRFGLSIAAARAVP